MIKKLAAYFGYYILHQFRHKIIRVLHLIEYLIVIIVKLESTAGFYKLHHRSGQRDFNFPDV